MDKTLWYGAVKSDSNLTWFEHAVQTYHVGRYLHNKLSLPYNRNEYLYSCFFHDVGKMLWKGFADKHTPYTREALAQIAGDAKYAKILKVFALPDYSRDDKVIHVIEKHHDADSALGLWVAAADHISSSATNPKGTIPLHAAAFAGLEAYNFYHLTIPTFSKNDYNHIGKLVLLKLIYECVQGLAQIDFLYETREGCRIATTMQPGEVRSLLGGKLVESFKEFITAQGLYDWFRGYPAEARTYAEMLPFTKSELMSQVNEIKKKELINNLLAKTKREHISLADCGLPENFFEQLATLELPEAGASKSSIAHYGGYQQALAELGVHSFTHEDEVLNAVKTHIMAANLIRNAGEPINFDLQDYIAIDGSYLVDGLLPDPEDEFSVCANCGTYRGVIKATTLLLQVVQHGRETLFRGRNASVRESLTLCLPCYLETLFNMFLCGIVSGQKKTVRDYSHLVVMGFDLPDPDLLFEEEKLEILHKMRIQKKSIYLRSPHNMQIALISLPDFYAGKNDLYRALFFAWMAWDWQENTLAVAVSMNCLPRVLSPQRLQLPHKDLEPLTEAMYSWFDYLQAQPGKTEDKVNAVARFNGDPLLGTAHLFRMQWPYVRYNAKLEEVVDVLSAEDKMFPIIDSIWEMARLSNGLETGKNVGAFLGAFKGRPEDVDRIANRMLKNPKLKKEKRSRIIEIWEEVRAATEKLSREERSALTKHIHATKYLMNSKKFYEIEKTKEDLEDA